MEKQIIFIQGDGASETGSRNSGITSASTSPVPNKHQMSSSEGQESSSMLTPHMNRIDFNTFEES